MDTKPLEIEAESYIVHKLIKYQFKVTKPSFDTEGADLLIVDSIKNKFTNFLKIQCKGRTIKNGSHIAIPVDYVTENFIIFLYIKHDSCETALFTFFHEDINLWNKRNDNYILNFNTKKINTDEFKNHTFSKKIVQIIK